MDSALGSFTVGFLLTSLTAWVQLWLNLLTAGWPTRPMWAAIAVSLLVGQLGAFLFAVASRITLDSAIIAQLVIVGFFGSVTAAGLNYQTIRAEQTKTAAGEIQQRLNGPKF